MIPARVDLLEREAELAAIDALISASPVGGAVLLFRGPAGIGKTRLLAETRARARAAEMEVLAARGSELEHEFAFGVARQLFEPLLASTPASEQRELFAGAGELSRPLFDPTEVGLQPSRDWSLAMLHGLFWLTANLSACRPVLLAVDDLHWCDTASLRWLAYLLPRIEGLPVVVAAGLRPAEAEVDAGLVAQIAADPIATIVRPGPLSERAAIQMVRQALSSDPDEAFATACYRESGGNPLLVRELTAAIAAEGLAPTSSNVPRVLELGARALSESISLRLARVTTEAAAVARAVAIFGDDADPSHAAALAELDHPAAAAAAAELSRLDLLRPDPPLGFVHPVVRAAVYAAIAPVERMQAHARAARVLRKVEAEAALVAAQLLHARPAGEQWVVATLQDAAREALARGAVDSAVAYLRRALAEPPPEEDRATVLLELGSAERLISGRRAATHLEEALSLLDDPVARAKVAVMLARTLGETGAGSRALDVRTRALEELGGSEGSLSRQLEAGVLGQAIMNPRLYPLALEHLSRAREAMTADDLGARMLLATVAYFDARACGAASQATSRARQALAGWFLLEEENAIPPFLMASLVLAYADADDAVETADAALAHTHHRGSAFAFAVAKLARGRTSFLRGAPIESEVDLRDARAALESWGIAGALHGWVAAYLADSLIEQGEFPEAEAALERAGFGEQVDDHAHTHWFLESRGRLRCRTGEVRRGLADLLECGRRFEAVGGRNPAFLAWRSEAALAYLRLSEPENATCLAEEEVALARQWGAPRALGRALRAHGLAVGGENGIGLLLEAVEVLERSPARLERAAALVELGAALRRANRRSDARDPLRRGLELATLCGARPLAERAETELLATGARPRRIALSGIESLTPSERRVADLAIAGSTNREIAQALFVTPRTVEVHLTSAYRKLGIDSRSQLASALTPKPGKDRNDLEEAPTDPT